MKALLNRKSETLKPCPFCKGKVKRSQHKFGFNSEGVYYFNCGKCGACVSFKDTTGRREQASNPIERWNQRV